MSSFFRNPTFHSKTSAVNHAGFPRLLWEMLSQALGCVVDPDYRVFQSEPAPRLCRYCAKVVIHLGPDKIDEPVIFEGRPMPTPALAIQTTAAAAISRLRSKFPQIGEMREFRYFPSASIRGGEFADATAEADPAIARLVQIVTAQGLLLGDILAGFHDMDNDAARVVQASYRRGRRDTSPAVDLLPSSPVLSSRVVPPSQAVPPSRVVLPSEPVDECISGTVYADPTNRTILQLYRQGLLQQDLVAAPGVESRLAEYIQTYSHGLSLATHVARFSGSSG